MNSKKPNGDFYVSSDLLSRSVQGQVLKIRNQADALAETIEHLVMFIDVKNGRAISDNTYYSSVEGSGTTSGGVSSASSRSSSTSS